MIRQLIRKWLRIPDQVVITRTKLIPEDQVRVDELLRQYVSCMSVNARLIEEGRQLRKMYEDLQKDWGKIRHYVINS